MNEELFRKLEVLVRRLTPAHMAPFPVGADDPPMAYPWLACPWMTAWVGKHKLCAPSEGMLLLQDWGVAESRDVAKRETLQGAAKLITDCASGGTSGQVESDRTLRNLFPSSGRGWKAAWDDRRWLITNAVWGLRPKGSKCGYLGRVVHKAAFPVWATLLAALARRSGRAPVRPLRIIVAGAWGRFDSPQQNPSDLAGYLCAWNAYVGGADNSFPGADLLVGDAEVSYCHHPATWNGAMRFHTDLVNGPPEH